MTVNEAINYLEDAKIEFKIPKAAVTARKTNEALDMAIKALEQQPCEDTISRADVEQTVEDNILCYTHSDRPIDQDPDTECDMAIRMALRMLRKDLRKLPSAQPERIRGRWIEKPHVHGVAYCSLCDYELHTNDTNFCPNCGAKMDEQENGAGREER